MTTRKPPLDFSQASHWPDIRRLAAAGKPRRVILFCDDLSFDAGEGTYKSLKAMLDAGIAGRPENVVFHATSNRCHLPARDMIENERATAINPAKLSKRKSRCRTASG